MNNDMTKELEEWLDDWSAKLDSFEAKLEKEVFNNPFCTKRKFLVLIYLKNILLSC